MGAGAHATSWDGNDAFGDPVGPGVYVVRLDTQAGPILRKLARTR
jgi:hypothetical protein